LKFTAKISSGREVTQNPGLMMQQCNKEEGGGGFRMNSSGSSGIDRTSSEESDVVPSRTGDSSPAASDEFEFPSRRQARTSVPAFFFPPISTNNGGSGVQSNGIKRKNSSPADSRMTPFASAAIATVNKIADRLGRLQKIERENVEREVIPGGGSNKSSKKSKQQNSTCGRSTDQPPKKGGSGTEAEQALIAEVLKMVTGLRQSTLSNVPAKHRQEVVDENARTDSSTEYAILLGRCFNLSMNLKILSQSTLLDPSLAGRVISDLGLLENSMVQRQEVKVEVKSDLGGVSSLFGGLRLDKIRNAGGRPRFGFL